MTQDELKQEISYNPNTGEIFRLIARTRSKIGLCTPCPDPHRGGYLRISILGKYYGVHQIAFMFMWGYIPKEIDHINHDPTDNRWINLRATSHPENGKNQSKHITNSSGVTGIHQRSSGNWRARIYHQGKHINLGHFKTKEEAIYAREQAEISYNFHENHGK